MIQVDRALFSNVISAVQRTSNLPGGGVNGLPNGVVIRGLQGVGGFGSDIQDAQKEFEKGRIRTSLERVRQLDSQFQSIVGRWNSSVNSVLSSARAGAQQISIHKLNEVKSAQSKMQSLARPASKSLQDLVTALELAVANEGRTDTADESDAETDANANAQQDPHSEEAMTEIATTEQAASTSSKVNVENESVEQADGPDVNLLGQFSINYRFGDKLEKVKGKDGRTRILPSLESERFYFFQGMEPPRVLRIRDINRDSIVVFDARYAQESTIKSGELKALLSSGIWRLESK